MKTILAIFLIVIFLISHQLLIYDLSNGTSIGYYRSDLPSHIFYVEPFFDGEIYIPHPLWHILVHYMNYITLNAKFSAAIVSALLVLMWIYIDPPGHMLNIQLAGTIAMLFLTVQHSYRKDLGKFIVIGSFIALAAYVFIMPHLSSFIGLGLLLFSGMFVVSFFFSGAARLAGQVAILNEIAVSNPQVYNFAAMANFTLGIILVLLVLFLLAYIIDSPRPEKAVSRMTARFFRSTEILMSGMSPNPEHNLSLLSRWKKDFYRHEMQTLPHKIGSIGMTINLKLFPDNSHQQVKLLMVSLQALVYRFTELFDADQDVKILALKLKVNIREWQEAIVKIHKEWSINPGVEITDELKSELIMKLKNLFLFISYEK